MMKNLVLSAFVILLAGAVRPADAQSNEPVAGKDYVEISNGTPPDPTSMLLMDCPLTLLYFGGILLCRFLPRAKSPYDELD